MPSKDEMFILENTKNVINDTNIVTMSQTEASSVNNIDVEQLVSELKENLRLNSTTSSLKVRSTYNNKASRPSPYRVPCRSLSEPACDLCTSKSYTNRLTNCPNCSNMLRHSSANSSKHHHQQQHQQQQQQQQQPPDDPYEMLQELIKSQSLIKEAVRRLQFNLNTPLNKTKTYVYDSDDECSRSPNSIVHQPICGFHLI